MGIADDELTGGLQRAGGGDDLGPVRIWLAGIAALIAIMVLVGGATRLTDSGLSITQWRLATGILPPMTADAWEQAFALYRQIPEYEQVNSGMSVDEFKTIFWWEWGHRMLGRVIGLAFALPLVFFYLTRRLKARHAPVMLALFAAGGLQGLIGWWMVRSGLTERVDVSQIRLAIHLVLACLIFSAIVAVAMTLDRKRGTAHGVAMIVMAGAILVTTWVQIFLGGLVAGLHAGLTFNTWPLMDGRLFPAGLMVQAPAWFNFFENVKTVQFDHRLAAYTLCALAIVYAVLAWRSRRAALARPGACVLALALAQTTLGIATLLAGVPISLALAHQAGALLLLIAAVWSFLATLGYD